MTIDSDGGNAPTYESKAVGELHLNHLADAEGTIRRAMERKLNTDVYALVLYFIAFLRGDAEAISQTAAVARSSRSTEDMIAHLEALALARSGRLQEARRMSCGRRRDRASERVSTNGPRFS